MIRIFNARRGLSPIFATLILIAIAVIAGIVVYMFTSGTISSMTGGGTAGQEKAAVQGVDVTATTPAALAQNTGSTPINIINAITKDSSGNIVAQNDLSAAPVPLDVGGGLATVPISLANTVAGQSYTVTLVSAKGGSFVSSSFIAPASTA